MEKKEKTNRLKKSMLVLLIIMVSLISFIGIYQKQGNEMKNLIPDYILGSDLKGYRTVNAEIDDATKDVIKDAEGNVIESATEEEIAEKGYTKVTEPVNKPETLTEQNYEKAKKILKERLKTMQVTDYKVRQDKSTGKMVVELKEDSNTDNVIASLTSAGKFEMQDSETKEVLLTNADLKAAKVSYSNETQGTAVYLVIQFNKEGSKKLEEISKKYVTTKDQEGNETTKKITMTLDGTTLISSSFETPITNGQLQLSIGSASNVSSTIGKYLTQASNMAMLLNNQEMPITYKIASNRFIQSYITKDTLKLILTVSLAVIIILLVAMIVKYKAKGLLSAISYIGLMAIVLLIFRYTNVEIGIGGLIGLGLVAILNYIVMMMMLKAISKQKEKNKAMKDTIIRFSFAIIPVYIISIVFTFITFLPIYSFGMVMFWGITMIILYHIIITKNLLLETEE